MRGAQLCRLLLAACVGATPLGAALRLVPDTHYMQGPTWGSTLVYDTDRDDIAEVIVSTTFRDILRIGLAFYEWWPPDSFKLVYSDTGTAHPQGIVTGNLLPEDVGRLDSDSLVDLVGTNYDYKQGIGVYDLVCQYEGPSDTSHPKSLVWYACYDSNAGGSEDCYLTDLDRDGRPDIVLHQAFGVPRIWENVGDDSCRLAALPEPACGGLGPLAIGDFDMDGRTEFVTTGDYRTQGWVWFWECAGDDQYVKTDSVPINRYGGDDIFEGDDTDQNGKPEFFVGFARYAGYWVMYLYQFEAVADNQYEATYIDSGFCGSSDYARQSKCGDIDGDGIQEVVWSTGTQLHFYRGIGPHQFRRECTWNNSSNCADVNIYDINNDGYKEVISSGNNETWVLGLEAIKVLYPNGREMLVPGDTVAVRWRRYEPPACDSVSLFLSADNGATWDTLATGLLPQDSSFSWVVPNRRSDSCLVRAVAYGPGWRADKSDNVFSIRSDALEAESGSPARASLSVLPNPTAGSCRVSFGAWVPGRSALEVFDVAGKRVRDLSAEAARAASGSIVWPGCGDFGLRLSAGVYLVRLRTGGQTLTRKVVLE